MTGLTSIDMLVGDWRLERRIVHGDGHEDRMTGLCRFTHAGPHLVQDESGTLEMATGRFQAHRRYVWTEARGRLDVQFADMRPFHSVPLGAERAETVHLCAPDRYHVAYDFTGWPAWRTVWTVEGPRKDYVMTTDLTPWSAARSCKRSRRGA